MMEDCTGREALKQKLRAYFDGKIVRKDLTKKIKEGASVPVYVLEFLLGQYCSSDDLNDIEDGVQTVKRILSENFVRPDEAQKILSLLRRNGRHTVIDRITVELNIKKDRYEAVFSNLGLTGVVIDDMYPETYDRLLCGGIWCIVQMRYDVEEDMDYAPDPKQKAKQSSELPIHIDRLTPIQMPHIDIAELKEGRRAFTKDEWMDVLLRSIGMEPDALKYREKWLLLLRMIPLVENNFNLCELGPRSTGKSHIYKEISPNSILVSGGQTTVANLFYNMSKRSVGLVGLWDCVAFDEVAGIRFKDKDGVQIMKDYMASGSFARGKQSLRIADTFNASVWAEDEESLQIKRLMDKYSFRHGKSGQPMCICAVGALQQIVRQLGVEALDRTLACIAATWPKDTTILRREMLAGLGEFWKRYASVLTVAQFEARMRLKLPMDLYQEVRRRTQGKATPGTAFSKSIRKGECPLMSGLTKNEAQKNRTCFDKSGKKWLLK